jgi:hypothetical protein
MVTKWKQQHVFADWLAHWTMRHKVKPQPPTEIGRTPLKHKVKPRPPTQSCKNPLLRVPVTRRNRRTCLSRRLKTTYTCACQPGALLMVATWKQQNILADWFADCMKCHRLKPSPPTEIDRNPLLQV